MRRADFVKSVLLSPLALALPTIVLLPSIAKAWWAEALQVAAAAFQLLAARNQSGNSLGALLQASNGKIDLIIAQLGEIQNAMQVLLKEVAAFNAVVANALSEQYAFELRNRIVAAIGEFMKTLKDAGFQGINVATRSPSSESFIEDLRAYYRQFSLARSELMTSREGGSIVACSIVEACYALDAQAFAIGLISESRMAQNLDEYIGWLERMLKKEDQRSVVGSAISASNERKRLVAEWSVKDPYIGHLVTADNAGETVAKFCFRYQVEMHYDHNFDGTQGLWGVKKWVKLCDTLNVFLVSVPIISKVDQAGTTLLYGVGPASVSVASYGTNDGLLFQSGDSAVMTFLSQTEVDGVKCETFRLAPYPVNAAQSAIMRNRQTLNHPDVRNTAWNHSLRDKRYQDVRSGRLANGKDRKATETLNGVFEAINLERTKLTLAMAARRYVLALLPQVRAMRTNYPVVLK